MHFGGRFITQKLLGTPNLVGVGQFFGPPIRIWKDLDPMCFWCLGASFSRWVYNTKVVVYVPNRYPSNGAWPQGQGIGLEGWAGPWRPMSGFLNKLESSNKTYASILFLKPHLNHPGQCRVTQASLLNKGQCVSVCVFPIEIRTPGWIWMKFVTEAVHEGRKVLGGCPGTPPSGYGVHKGGTGGLWSLDHAFWQKLYKTKVGAGHFYGPKI